jgi:multidrug efflux pump subunit AcrA (membrane-fusion protein)
MKASYANPNTIACCALLAACLALVSCSAPATKKNLGADQAASQRPGQTAPAAEAESAEAGSTLVLKAVAVTKDSLETTHETSGTIVAKSQSRVAAQASGVVSSILHRPGDWVSSGETVVRLDDTLLKLADDNAKASLENARLNLETAQRDAASNSRKRELELKSAQSALSAAQKNYDGMTALLKSGGASESEVATAESALEAARAAVEAARNALENSGAGSQSIAQLKIASELAENNSKLANFNLQNASVRAPYDGQIRSLAVNEGEYVANFALVFQIAGSDKSLGFSIPVRDVGVFDTERAVTFEINGQSYAVRITQMPTVPVDGLVSVLGSLDSSRLPYGSVGTVRYSIRLAEGFLVPSTALQSESGEDFVFLLADGRARRKGVSFLSDNGRLAAVLGLAIGDRVLENPPKGLVDGSAVKEDLDSSESETE